MSTPTKSMKRQKGNLFNTLIRKLRPGQNHVSGLPLLEQCDAQNHVSGLPLLEQCDTQNRVLDLSLEEICDLPRAIIDLMVFVYQKGQHIEGILRVAGNIALEKKIKEQINSGAKYEFEDDLASTVAAAASVLKYFLRRIQDGLIPNKIYTKLLKIKPDYPEEKKIQKIKKVLSRLRRERPLNYKLLKLTICLLQHLAKHQDVNKMDSKNLAICIAPSFLDSEGQVSDSSMKKFGGVFIPLISFMITKHTEIFGEDILDMFAKYGCKASPPPSLDEDTHDHHIQASEEEEDEEGEEEMLEGYEEEEDEQFDNQPLLQQQRQQRQQHLLRDSKSGQHYDSTDSMLYNNEVDIQRDYGSMDSLLDLDYYIEQESRPRPTHLYISQSNLSRDSGLALSDAQLNDGNTGLMDVPGTTKLNQHESHEAEEVNLTNRPHLSLIIQPDSPTKATFPTSSPQNSSPAFRKHSLSSQLAPGSPPPHVILQLLQQVMAVLSVF